LNALTLAPQMLQPAQAGFWTGRRGFQPPALCPAIVLDAE